ncbi:MAG: hypothetical protein EON54_09475 [Alcaligenaceae bacterium]|nr:MAG: hypothetical protein EON54_09475 [Alcaligenaceae bacterium]
MPYRTLAQLYGHASRLTPDAARFAELGLCRSPGIAFEVRHAMLAALMYKVAAATLPPREERSSLEQSSSTGDAQTLADADEARLFVNECAEFGADGRSDSSGRS